jgi:trimethylamine-N-oxide reductase (cytochrome c), cytochrome c-type subunit TorC
MTSSPDETRAPTPSGERGKSRRRTIAGFISLSVIAVFASGVILGAAPLLGMKATDSTEFCISCHSMTHLWEVTKASRHFQNDSGVQVGCPSCHVPHPIADYLQVKMLALHDVYSEVVNPVNTKEDYEARRPELAQKVRADFLKNDSAQCRTCHAYENFTRPIKAHDRAQKAGTTCIKCHYNLVHGEIPWDEMDDGKQKQASAAPDRTEPSHTEGKSTRIATAGERKHDNETN